MLGRIKKVIVEKYGARLATQLIVTFIGMFVLIIAASSVFVYTGIVNILKSNSEKNSLHQFRQYEYNINTFCNEVDLISRQLIVNAHLQSLIGYENLPDVHQVTLVKDAFDNFSQMISNYKFIKLISYYGDNGLILRTSPDRNEIFMNEAGNRNWFYDSEIYNKAREQKLKLLWFGGYTDKDFKIAEYRSTAQASEPEYYISAARSILSGNQTGTLVINVDLRYFTSIYNNSYDPGAGEMYLVNGEDIIISHNDAVKIGKQSKVLSGVDLKSRKDNVALTDGNEKVQVVFYKIGNLGWTMVNEVPIHVLIKDIYTLQRIVLLMIFAGLVLAVALSRYWIYRITLPLRKLTDVMKKMEQGKLGLTLDKEAKNELGTLVGQFNKMSRSIHDLVRRNEAIQEEKRRIEIEALQSQINPHFIYNTINTIKWMAVIIKAGNIIESLSTLGDILQPIFKKHDIMCSLEEEINYVKNYIKIMNYRFAGGFKTDICIPEELGEYQVLRFILQPLVENSIYHGLLNQNGGEIGITAEERDGDIVLLVSDNGEGIAEAKLTEIYASLKTGIDNDSSGKSSIGLVNINRRIQLHFGENYGLTIQNRKTPGTTVTVKLPKVRKS